MQEDTIHGPSPYRGAFSRLGRLPSFDHPMKYRCSLLGARLNAAVATAGARVSPSEGPFPENGGRMRSSAGSATPQGGRNIEHYKQIGQTLTICEAGGLGVGVPWVPPSARIKVLRALYTELQPEDFARLNLTTVTTESLISYAEDLEVLPCDAHSADILHIPLTDFERNGGAALTAVTVFAIGYYLLLAVSAPPAAAGLGSLIPALVLALAVRILSSEKFRRRSFRHLLDEEISRRTGAGKTPLKPLRLGDLLLAMVRPGPRPTATGA